MSVLPGRFQNPRVSSLFRAGIVRTRSSANAHEEQIRMLGITFPSCRSGSCLRPYKGGHPNMRTIIFALAATLLSSAALAQTAPVPAPAQPPVFVSVDEASALVSSLKGLDVKNAGDETVGEIEDVVIAGNSLASYILSVGGFLGLGIHYVAVSPSALAVTWNQTDKKWNARINATKEQLKAAPQFKYEGRFAK
ncbi:PRC-barrel domain-containing protein [Bosea sp. 2YAB26]|uniref:PRC-barrel domain-containing protein n=1 Tax=Bosea sp. 2YAB26 TaxID=3237478 RepID=UPI003F91E693